MEDEEGKNGQKKERWITRTKTLKKMFVQEPNNKIYRYRDRNVKTMQIFSSKELRKSDFLITIGECVGARETPLSTTKK